MALKDELGSWTATELAHAIRTRKLSPREVMDATIARIEARNPSLNAFVFTAFDEAREGARQAEQAVMRGDELGPLHGVPSALKDLFSFKPGWPATFGGVRAMRDYRPTTTGFFTERMTGAGAILVGTTNSPVMGFRGACDNYLFGPTGNPFDPSRNSGGSSGGAAAAVGDGMLTIAEATDGGGSIRIPSSWCGVYGFKPSAGRVPVVARPNGFVTHCPFIHEGVAARTVEDTALSMSVLSGWDPRDPMALDEKIDFPAATRRSLKGWKIAYSPKLDVYPVDRRVQAVVHEAVKAFQDAGAIVEEVQLGLRQSQQELSDLWCRLITPLSITAFENLKRNGTDLVGQHRDDLPPEFLHWYELGMRQLAVDVYRDLETRTQVFDAVQSVLTRYDLLVSPTLTQVAVPNATDRNTVGPREVEGETVDPLIGWCMTYLFNFTGHPAASVPAGLADSLPVGLQIVGRRYADSDVIAASAAFERVRPWRDLYKIPEQRAL